MEETKSLLEAWDHIWPKKSFSNEYNWLTYCRKWWPILPEIIARLKK